MKGNALILGMMVFFFIVGSVNAETLDMLDHTDVCEYNTITEMDRCKTTYYLCEPLFKPNKLTFMYKDLKGRDGIETDFGLVTDFEITEEEKDCFKIELTAIKDPFMDIDNILCYDGNCHYEFAWWNGSYQYSVGINLTADANISAPYQLNFTLDMSNVPEHFNFSQECYNISDTRARFLDEAEENVLDARIVLCDADNSRMNVFVNVTDVISTPADGGTMIYLYYGNNQSAPKNDYSAVYGMSHFETVADFNQWNHTTLSGSNTFEISTVEAIDTYSARFLKQASQFNFAQIDIVDGATSLKISGYSANSPASNTFFTYFICDNTTEGDDNCLGTGIKAGINFGNEFFGQFRPYVRFWNLTGNDDRVFMTDDQAWYNIELRFKEDGSGEYDAYVNGTFAGTYLGQSGTENNDVSYFTAAPSGQTVRTFYIDQFYALTATDTPPSYILGTEREILGVHLIEPQNITYNETSVPLTFSVRGNFTSAYYSLNNASGVNITGNTTITAANGSNHLLLVATGLYGEIIEQEVYFTVSEIIIQPFEKSESFCFDEEQLYTKDVTRTITNGAVSVEKIETLTSCSNGCYNSTLFNLGNPGCAENDLLLSVTLVVIVLVVGLIIRRSYQ